MINKIEHLGVAVADLSRADDVIQKLLGKSHYKHETVESESVKTSFYRVGESKIELLEATDQTSAIAKYLEKNRPGMHHLAFDVDNILEEMARLKKEGFIFINDRPKEGADGKLVAFIHPKSTQGILVELCQDL